MQLELIIVLRNTKYNYGMLWFDGMLSWNYQKYTDRRLIMISMAILIALEKQI